MRFVVVPETQIGPGPYSVYVEGAYLTTVDTKAEVEKIREEQEAGAASSGRR